jgi:hypothetical protein
MNVTSQFDQENQPPNENLDPRTPEPTYDWVDSVMGSAVHKRHANLKNDKMAKVAVQYARDLGRIPFQPLTRSLKKEVNAAIVKKTERKTKKRSKPSETVIQPVKPTQRADIHRILEAYREIGAVNAQLEAKTGYKKSRLYAMLKGLRNGRTPNQIMGRPQRVHTSISEHMTEMAGTSKVGNYILDTIFLMSKLCLCRSIL